MVNTNLGVLGLDLHSNSPEPVNFLRGTVLAWGGAIFVWGAQAAIWGARPRNAPRGAGPDVLERSCKKIYRFSS